LNISAANTPGSIAWRFNRYRASPNNRSKVPIAVVAFETDRPDAIRLSRIQNENEIAERKRRQSFVLKIRFHLPNPTQPIDRNVKVPDADVNMVKAHEVKFQGEHSRFAFAKVRRCSKSPGL